MAITAPTTSGTAGPSETLRQPAITGTGTAATRWIGVADDRLDGAGRPVRARALAARRGPGRERADACTSTSARSGWRTSRSCSPRRPSVGVLWKKGTGTDARPHRGSERGDRRGVHGAHAVRRRAVGSDQLGQVLGVGRAGHHHRVPVHHLRRLPRGPRPRWRPAAARSPLRRGRAPRGARDPAGPLQREAVALRAPGRERRRPHVRRHPRRADAVHPDVVAGGVQPAVRLVGAAPPAGARDAGRARRAAGSTSRSRSDAGKRWRPEWTTSASSFRRTCSRSGRRRCSHGG